MEAFGQWLELQYRHAAAAMLRSISPLDIVKSRPGFGQTVRPLRGAIVASPVPASYDPEPDYFFHWYRDSSVVIDAVRALLEAGAMGAQARAHFADFVSFALALRKLDGRALVQAPGWRTAVTEDFRQYVRSESELETIHGDAVAADTRVNPDGTLDISKWARPQHDGPALRALAVLNWLGTADLDCGVTAAASQLLRSDLEFTFRRARVPSYDIWEEERGLHYYTLCVSAAALARGAGWLERSGQDEQAQAQAQAYRAESMQIRHRLDGFWSEEQGFYRSRSLPGGERSTKELDIAVVLAAIHAGGAAGAHTVADPRMHATLARLESLFDAAYPINHNRPAHTSPAMGRYAGDVYYSGGAYFFSTLGAAEFCFRAAAVSASREDWMARGDGYLATVRAYIPEGGGMSEQFDQRTGAPTSARELAWSYAAFISCIGARRAVIAGS